MKDVPFFETEFGVASLALGEIPYRREAYIRVQSVLPGQMEALVQECAAFCRAAGAERIYWSAGEAQGQLYTAVYEMRGRAWVDPQKLESLFPVTEATVAQWRRVYNQRMEQVDNASTLTAGDEGRILSGSAYFVHSNGTLLGIGWLEDTTLLTMAATVPGAGERVMHTLMSLVEGADMRLEVASTNEKAIALYEKLGFLKTAELRRWYRT